MFYPQDFEIKIGFDKIREMLFDYCLSDMGRELVDKIQAHQQISKISVFHTQTDEMLQILDSHLRFPQADYFNLIPAMERIVPPGTYLSLEELPDFKSSLKTITAIKQFFIQDEEENFPALIKLTSGIDSELSFIFGLVDRLLDKEGNIHDKASSKLQDIRKQLVSKEKSISSSLRKIFQESKNTGLVDSKAEMTVRGGRLVIPVPASNKRQINGFIHDQSASGQTVFIEPSEIFEGNNEILQLKNDEKREVIKILKDFSSEVRFHIPELIRAYRILGTIDFIRAKAKLAQLMNGIRPRINSQIGFSWLEARHPLLELSLKKDRKEIIPLDISLNSKDHILIISGPNAGGKSVALKTVALIQYMLQCGLLVPVDIESDFCLFDQIFIDIGDQQSIEKDLSTYSSHLLNMNHFLLKCTPKTLILIDEFGTGTDPQLGGAIAQAILEKLIQLKVFGIITTHYSNIKKMGTETTGIQNAAMLFDVDNLSPLFQMIPGQPGHSYAFSIARNAGIQEEIIENAELYAGKTQVDYEDQLNQLKTKLLKLEKDQEKIDFTDDVLESTLEEYQNKLSDLKKKEKEILAKAKSDAAYIIDGANKKIEQTIKEIKEAEADKEKTKKIRETLLDEKRKLTANTSKVKPLNQKTKTEIQIGDYVRLKENGSIVEVIRIKNAKTILVQNENIKLEINIDQVEKTSKKILKSKRRSSKGNIYQELNKKLAKFHPLIDIRGKRAEEAIVLVDKLIDDAILLSVNELRIIHGKGDGILRKLIREHLSRHPNILSITDENTQFGGQGISIVKMN